jgi:hypothetical protein
MFTNQKLCGIKLHKFQIVKIDVFKNMFKIFFDLRIEKIFFGVFEMYELLVKHFEY